MSDPGTYNLSINQGATFAQVFTWTTSPTTSAVGAASAPVNVTGYTASMQFRAYPLSTTILYDASANLVLGGAAGTITLTIPAATTQTFTWWNGVYDLILTDPAGVVTRLLQGTVVVTAAVTSSTGSYPPGPTAQQSLGLILYPQTAAEIQAGVVPVQYFYPPGNVLRYGADSTQVADSTTAFANAGLALGASGGTVIVPASGKFKINNNVNVPVGVQWKGEFFAQAASRSMVSGSINFTAFGSSIALAPAATITLFASAGLKGVILYNSALTYPTTSSGSFAGTAVTIAGPDTYVGYSLIAGFTKGVNSNGFERLKCEWVLGDNNTGIEITACNDVPRLMFCHMWPFASYIPNVPSLTYYHRTGSAYYLHDTVDGAQVTDCFSYGYMQGFNLSNVSTAHLVGNFADNTQLLSGSSGFLFNGNINVAALIGNSAWNATNGFNLTMNAGQEVHLSSCTATGNTGSAIIVTSGNARISNNFLNSSPYALTYNNSTNSSVVHFDQNSFAGITTRPILCNFNTTNLIIGEGNYWIDGAFGTSLTGNINDAIPQIASAATLALPNFNNYILVTGTVAIATMTGGYAGRPMTLLFNNTASMSYGGGADQFILAYGQTFNAVSGASISFIHDGFAWKEKSRSIPAGGSSGWGTPTGGGVVNNFAAATATTLQTNQALASLINEAKARGAFLT
jgi:hypothetical protein